MPLSTIELNDLLRSYNFRSFLKEGRQETFNEVLFTYLEGYGGEGQGDDWWVVFSMEKDGIKEFVKFSTWYSSYEGIAIKEGDFEQVKPVQKVITVWESV